MRKKWNEDPDPCNFFCHLLLTRHWINRGKICKCGVRIKELFCSTHGIVNTAHLTPDEEVEMENLK